MKQFNGYKRGINLGGWLSQCEYTTEHYKSFISESDIERIAGWKLDHIRLPFDYQLLRDDNDNILEENYTYIDNCIKWCEKYNLNLILDLHKTAGFSFDEDVNTFFENSELQERFYSLWIDIAKRYSKYDFIAFELLNEVVEIEVADKWNEIAEKTVKCIREYAPDTKIIIGGVQNNSALWVHKLSMPYDENIVYTFHFYEPLIFTHQSAYWIDTMSEDFKIEYPCSYDEYLKASYKYLPKNNSDFLEAVKVPNIDADFFRTSFADAIRVATERNVPLYCGEYGVIDRALDDSALRWFKDISGVFNEYNIGRATWTYKSKDFGITDEHYSAILDDIIPLL
ncbi:MAG: cellulase family glycosylhydrolase [Ruminococcus sp.]|nr:cellulase family glycosylhydrolase [Ruminococcus sp.]